MPDPVDPQPAAELELTRSDDDRRLYVLAGVGTLRPERRSWRAATAEADGAIWRFERKGLFGRRIEASDAAGAEVAAYEPRRGVGRGGTIRWSGRQLVLRPARSWRAERFVLLDGDRELGRFEGMSSNRRPVRISLAEPEAIGPGLLLFTTFVVRGLTLDAVAAIAASASVGTGA